VTTGVAEEDDNDDIHNFALRLTSTTAAATINIQSSSTTAKQE